MFTQRVCSNRTAAALVLLAASCVAAPTGLRAATEFQLAQWATELNIASTALAGELRHSRYFGGLRLRADRLARESADLVEAIRRNRSSSRVRSRFRDLSRSYNDFEQEFFRANRRSQDAYVLQEVGYISQLFASLNDGYYFSPFYPRRSQPIYRNPPQVIVTVPSRACRGRCDNGYGRGISARHGGRVIESPRVGKRVQPRGYGYNHGAVELPQSFSANPRRSDAENRVARGSRAASGRERVERIVEQRRQEHDRRRRGYHD